MTCHYPTPPPLQKDARGECIGPPDRVRTTSPDFRRPRFMCTAYRGMPRLKSMRTDHPEPRMHPRAKVSTDGRLFRTLDSKSRQPRLRAWGGRDHVEANNPTRIVEMDPRGVSGPNPCGWPLLKALEACRDPPRFA
jgi:hypothetical protein